MINYVLRNKNEYTTNIYHPIKHHNIKIPVSFFRGVKFELMHFQRNGFFRWLKNT